MIEMNVDNFLAAARYYLLGLHPAQAPQYAMSAKPENR